MSGSTKRLVTQLALERSVSAVDIHVPFQMFAASKHLVTAATFVRFLSAVNNAVPNKMTRLHKSSATNGTLELFSSRMTTPPVSFQRIAVSETFAAFCALVLLGMSIHMET